MLEFCVRIWNSSVSICEHAVLYNGTYTYSSFCGLNFMLHACRPNCAKIACITCCVEQASSGQLNLYNWILCTDDCYDITHILVCCKKCIVGLTCAFVFKVTLGTISNVDEAVQWLSYTYLFVRMKINPQCYGINYQDVHVSQNF